MTTGLLISGSGESGAIVWMPPAPMLKPIVSVAASWFACIIAARKVQWLELSLQMLSSTFWSGWSPVLFTVNVAACAGVRAITMPAASTSKMMDATPRFFTKRLRLAVRCLLSHYT